MEPDKFYIYSFRMQAWVGQAGGTSDLSQARTFSWEMAKTYCQNNLSHDGALGAIPLPISLVKEIRE